MGVRVILYLATTLGFAVSIGFLCVSLFPDQFGMNGMPILLRVTACLFGAVMLVCSLFAVRHGLRVRQARRTVPVIPDRVEVEVENGSDDTSYTLIAQLGGTVWAVPVYAGKGVGLIERNLAQDIRAWCDPKTGAPIEFLVDGSRVETHPHAMRR